MLQTTTTANYSNYIRVCHNVQFYTKCAVLILICAVLTAHLSRGANSARPRLLAGFWGGEKVKKQEKGKRGRKVGGENEDKKGGGKGKETKGRRSGNKGKGGGKRKG